MVRSAIPCTPVKTTGRLLPVFISGSLAVRNAVLVSIPGFGVFTTTVTVALALLVMVPKLQLMTPEAFAQLPRVLVNDRNCTPAGRRFVRLTPVKVVRPLLLIRIV